MDTESLCLWLQATPFALTIRESDILFPIIEGVHVLSTAFVVGSIAIVDLRLLGFRAFNHSIRQLMAEVLPLTWLGFSCAVLTGASLFSSNAVEYSRSIPFGIKILLLILVAINMFSFHLLVCRNMSQWDQSPRAPFVVGVAGFLSLVLWVGVVACGRWIGFVNAS